MPRKIKVARKKATEPDEFISTSSVLVDYAKRNYLAVAAVLSAVLISALIAGGWLYYSRGREREAVGLFNRAEQIYQRVAFGEDNDQPRDQRYRSALQEFEKLTRDYSRTPSATISFLYLGDCSYRLREYDKAIDYYLSFINRTEKSNYLRYFAFEGLGYSYEEKGDFKKALDSYKRSLEEGNGALDELTYLNMARCYEALDDTTSARDYYSKAASDQGDSLFAEVARQKATILQN